jgi:hypothetical protein
MSEGELVAKTQSKRKKQAAERHRQSKSGKAAERNKNDGMRPLYQHR